MSLAASASSGSARRHNPASAGLLGTGHSSRGSDSLSRELGGHHHHHHGSHRCSNNPSGSLTSASDSQQQQHHHHQQQQQHHDDTEWEAKEELRQRELEEARARAAQMEKTMRWWSDCTANWREKWSKVRTERNKAREEVRLLRAKLEAAAKDNGDLRREKGELEQELQLERRTVRHHGVIVSNTATTISTTTANTVLDNSSFRRSPSSSSGGNGNNIHAVPERDVEHRPEKLVFRQLDTDKMTLERDCNSLLDDEDNDGNGGGKLKRLLGFDSLTLEFGAGTGTTPNPSPTQAFADKAVDASELEVSEGGMVGVRSPSSIAGTGQRPTRHDKEEGGGTIGGSRKYCSDTLTWDDVSSSSHADFVDPRLCELQLRLDEASKTVQAEREEKSSLHKSIEKMHIEINDLKLKYEELKILKQDALKELSQAKSEHQDELDSIRLDLEDEANSRSSMDRRLADLRTQLERLQTENAAEWGKRERLETEKLTLERENKKLRTQIEELEDRIERKSKSCATGGEADKTLQHELHDRNKELTDLRHNHSKLKKALQEKTTELQHASRRAEQYETEVKKLRGRVEELKKELATAEDEVDNTTNNIRKVQRLNDELQEQVDSLQVQVDHLQTRLRNNSHSLLALRGSNSLLNDGLSEDENGEF